MKKIFVLVVYVFVIQMAVSQSFEGYIKTKIEIKVSGQPKGGASSADIAQAKAGIEQMKAQLNDPNIKNNPQAKAQIEKAIQMMEGLSSGNTSDMIASFLPKSILIKIKNGNRATIIEGGPAAGRTINLKGSDQTISINDKNKTYSKNTFKAEIGNDNFKVQKTSETAKILGYTCVKYVVTGVDKRTKKPSTTFFWTTTDVAGIDYDELYKSAGGDGQSFYFKGVTGVPLKIEAKADEGSFTLETIEIKQIAVSDSDFSIPVGYKETKSSY